MAFCIRSKRKMEFENKDFIPGPGQYFKISSKLVQNNKRKTPPFFISAKRAPFVKLNDIPGPGSYNLDIRNKTFLSQQPNSQMQSTSATNIISDNTFNELITNYYTSEKNNTNISNIWNYSNTSKYNNFSTKNKSYYSKDKAIQNSKLYKITETFFNNKANNNFIGTSIGFLSQTTRFNDNKNNDSNNLGPGCYYESIIGSNNKIEKKIKNKIKAGKLFGKSSSSRVVSIPSKTMNGYIYKKDISGNNSFNKNSENNNDNLSLSSTISKNKNNKISLVNLKNSSKPNKNKELSKEENKLSDDQYQLLINEKKFGNTTTTATSEFIGPGTYDVSLIEKKKNKCINWSKGFNIEKIDKKNNIIEKVKLFEEEMKKSEEIPLIRKTHNKIQTLRQNKNKILLLYSLRKIKNNILKNKLPDSTRSSSFIPDKTEIPGPGYYDKEIIPNEQKISKNNSIQDITNKLISKTPKLNFIKYLFNKNKINNKIESGFGSNCERAINKSKSLEELSPFSYFKEKNKYDPGKKNTLYKNIILGKTDLSRSLYKNFDFYSPYNSEEINYDTNLLNNVSTSTLKENNKSNKSNKSAETEKYLFRKFDNYDLFSKINNIPLIDLDRYTKLNDDNPGPGNYELSHKFIIPTFSHGNTLQDKAERFKDDLINENPGPGSYQLRKNFDKNIINNKKILFKKTKADLVKEENIKKAIDKNKKGNEVPGVGYYNLDKKNSLVYKVNLKLNKKQCYNSPFLISSSRFKRQINLSEISSADYDPYKFENIQKNNQFMVFNKANRFNKENNLNIGPGSYDLNNNWNKKSYNKLFFSNKEEI